LAINTQYICILIAFSLSPKKYFNGKFCFNYLNPNGVITTYCSKGIVKRALRSANFLVQRLPGPSGKWEMLRAIK